MVDTTQLLLNITLSITTIFLVIIGVQLILLVRDIRKTLKGINLIIDNLEKIGVNASSSMKEIVGFITSVKFILEVLKQVKHEK